MLLDFIGYYFVKGFFFPATKEGKENSGYGHLPEPWENQDCS